MSDMLIYRVSSAAGSQYCDPYDIINQCIHVRTGVYLYRLGEDLFQRMILCTHDQYNLQQRVYTLIYQIPLAIACGSIVI